MRQSWIEKRVATWAVAAGLLGLCFPCAPAISAPLPVDDAEGRPGEWGFRPVDGEACAVNPPAFVWRPQRSAVKYEIECSRDAEFANVGYRAEVADFNCHTPDRVFDANRWFWRFRFVDNQGNPSAWSRTRSCDLNDGAVEMPMPDRAELLQRIPDEHPRLFVRPEDIPRLRALAAGTMNAEYRALVARCDRLLADPPPTAEPKKYPPGTVSHDETWRVIWWGNREYTIRALDGAATLAFTRLLGGKEEYGIEAKRILLEAAKWDPVGATGYRYNDEAGMPYAYYFSRTYTFVHDLLTEEERAACRRVMAVRGAQMYKHLRGTQLWRPYGSHANRAWHFLGEVGIAFHGEIPEADQWTWLAANVFFHTYPVWSDDDGGWHEGICYWSSYINRFTWWADVMRSALRIDAYDKPYFSTVGYYPLYLQPPGTVGGGFGDLTARRRSSHNRSLMTVLAHQANNPYWQWYVDRVGGAAPQGGYVGFVRGTLPKVDARSPAELPSSRCFRGTGQAVLNSNLLDAADNVQVIFKSSPFGTQSHGYESQNSFLLYAFGERVFIRTGLRDIYGSNHHRNWMWETKSTNCVTLDGHGQGKHSSGAAGRILAFHTSKRLDFVSGEAQAAYGDRLDRFTRHIVFVKPELVVVFDLLEAPEPARFGWHLHAATPIEADGAGDMRVVAGRAACEASLVVPEGLDTSVTDRFDPPPRPRVKLVEWHLTARTKEPARRQAFIATLRPHRADRPGTVTTQLHKLDGGFALEAELSDGRAIVIMRTDAEKTLRLKGHESAHDVTAVLTDETGKVTDAIRVEGTELQAGQGPRQQQGPAAR